MKKTIGFASILICLIVLLCLGMTTTFVIKGKVLADSVPIPFAHVRIPAYEEYDLTNYNGEFEISAHEGFDSLVVAAWAEGYFNGMSKVFPDDSSIIISLHKLYEEDNPNYQWLSPLKDSLSPDNCGNCHANVLMEQWSNNAHANSATNPFFLSMYYGMDSSLTEKQGIGYKIDFPDTNGNCATCHIPGAAVHDPWGIDPLSVDEVSKQGVFCDVCHKIQNVNITDGQGTTGVLSIDFLRPPEGEQMFFGPYDDIHEPDAYLPLIRKSEFCAACHTGKFWGTEAYNSFNEWKNSPYPEMGIECQTCHMYPDSITTHFVLPEKGGLERNPLQIPSHLQPGSRDPQILENSVTMNLSAEQVDDSIKVMVTIQNDKTGHHVPTGRPSRNMILLVSVKTAEDENLDLINGERIPDWGGMGEYSAGNYAGLPGKGYAKILEDFDEISPAPSWRPTHILSDNRIAAFATDSSLYYFKIPGESLEIDVSARLIYRRFFKPWMTEKGFDIPDIEMEREIISIKTLPVSIEARETVIPESFWLGQNWPNPFNATTTINFSLKEATRVLLTLHDSFGRTVLTITNQHYDAGTHYVLLNCSELLSGEYYYKMNARNFTDVKKCLILK